MLSPRLSEPADACGERCSRSAERIAHRCAPFCCACEAKTNFAMQQSKYERWHDAIIARARLRRLDLYCEQHHVRPRSLGGDDSPANLVDLTYREHFLVHWLLTKICSGNDKHKMVMALHCMTMPLNEGRRVGGWRIEVSKRAIRGEWIRRRLDRHAREIDQKERALALAAKHAAVKAVWKAAEQRQMPVRGASGQFVKVKRRRKRPRAGRKARERQREAQIA